ncbi:putative orfan [Tupanvirus soda lake]|uniref:Orfan n=2 Tax=Tupanvirus TaxID=2094720 RepID=A0AC62AB56_9VIRU|nr:putative orfan [Tupanvirus soda lake]QKU34924.1 putative orfan [Tupanvirus soda lake]
MLYIYIMPIIFFPGQGTTAKILDYQYINDKYENNDFVDQLRMISHVIIPEIPYNHVHYYEKSQIDSYKDMFKPIKNINFDDLFVENFIKNFYSTIDNQKKYIVIAHSDGIYFAMEFSRQYPQLVKHIISLDGSWITKELCQRRFDNWNKRGKNASIILSQSELDDIFEKVKNETNNDIHIKKILDHTRFEHTEECINKKYENIIKEIPFTVFRDFSSDIQDHINAEFNKNALDEHNILIKKSDKYQIFWLVDASHYIWFNKYYKKQIIKFVSNLVLIDKFIEKYRSINDFN